MYGRQPIPMKPIANMVRHMKRMKAVLSATHLCGLLLNRESEVTIELLEPSKEPFFPQDDHRFKLEGLSTPEQPSEPILSIYSSGLPERIWVPLSQITAVAVIPAASLAGKMVALSSPLSEAYPNGMPIQIETNHLVILQENAAPIVFAYPRRSRGAQKIVGYYYTKIGLDKDPISLSELGVQ